MKTLACELARLVTLLVTCLLILVATKAPAAEPVPAAPAAGSLFDAMLRAEQELAVAVSKSEKALMDAKLAATKRLADLKAKAEVELKAAVKSVEPEAVAAVDAFVASKVKQQEILQSLSRAVEKLSTAKEGSK